MKQTVYFRTIHDVWNILKDDESKGSQKWPRKPLLPLPELLLSTGILPVRYATRPSKLIAKVPPSHLAQIPKY